MDSMKNRNQVFDMICGENILVAIKQWYWISRNKSKEHKMMLDAGSIDMEELAGV